jgi:hypothetical protein
MDLEFISGLGFKVLVKGSINEIRREGVQGLSFRVQGFKFCSLGLWYGAGICKV